MKYLVSTQTGNNMTNNITLVTGIWDLQRGEAKEGWKRPFQHYKDKFKELLVELKDYNLIIYADPELEDFVWQYRSKHNTQIIHHPKEYFKPPFFAFFDQVQKIRNDDKWKDQVGWLRDSTQSALEYYNPMVMSKMFMLHNARNRSVFNDDYMYWIDGGLSTTVSLGYFKQPDVIQNLKKVSSKLLFACFPYETNSEIHGFNIRGMRKYSENQNVNRVARGGFFGGNKKYFDEANNLYYDLLSRTLGEGLMGTEESIFTIMTYLDPHKYRYRMIDGNGLVYKFFEDLKAENFDVTDSKQVNLYIITYNAPNQLQMVLDSFEKHDTNFLTETNLILVNNSLNEKTFAEYDKICEKYNIKEYHLDNIGICGGRQWAAEHFDKSDAKYMMFFEDDMLLDLNGSCKCGLSKRINQPFETCVNIMEKEDYDFLKMCFSEFYGDNSDQWAWHNVPQHVRDELFPNTSKKPPTEYKCIKTYEGTPYAEGNVYYCNWPHIMGKEGNKKCFLDTKWAHPYEQTWMSHIYQLTVKKEIKPAILLASPFTHNRITHYAATERKEN